MQEDTVNNRYEVIKKIGQGAFGTVHLAISKQKGTQVAIKIIPVTDQNRENVVQEISSLSQLSTPNCNPYVVCYYGSFIDSAIGSVVIEMEYIDGPDIMVYTQPLRVSGDRLLLYRTSKLLLVAMLSGLQYIHQNGIIHNDVKPSNILVRHNKVPVLADLGISCITQEAVKAICTEPYNKVVGDCCREMAGTSLYLPPEALKDIRYGTSDLWSLGATVYNIVTGDNIWSLNTTQYTPVNLMAQVIKKFTDETLPNRLVTGDQGLDTVVNSFLQYDPTARMDIGQALGVLQSS